MVNLDEDFKFNPHRGPRKYFNIKIPFTPPQIASFEKRPMLAKGGAVRRKRVHSAYDNKRFLVSENGVITCFSCSSYLWKA